MNTPFRYELLRYVYSNSEQHDAAAEHLLDALRKGAAGLWVADAPNLVLEKAHTG